MHPADPPETLRRRRILWILLGVGLVGFVFALLAVPRIPWVKTLRSDQLAKEAGNAMKEGRWNEAREKTIAAYQLNPTNPQSLRAAADLNFAAGMPQALSFYQRLVESGSATGEDYRNYAESQLRAGAYSTFPATLEEASNRLPGDARVALLSAQYAMIAEDHSRAKQTLASLLANENAPLHEKLQASRLLLAMPAREDREVGATWMIENPKQATPDDFAAIVQNRELSEDLKRRAAQAWESRLNTSEEGGSLQPRIYFIQSTSPHEEIPTQLEALRKEVKTDDDRRALAMAFMKADNPGEALEILPLTQAVARKDLFLVWLDAMAATGAWDEIRDVLLSENIPLEPGLTSLYLGRCYEAAGNESAASLQYENAARFTTKDQELLFYIAGYFNRWQRPQMAEFVLRRLTGDPQSSRMAYEALLNIHRANRDEEKMFEVLNEMHERWPQDLAVANDRNYLSLLLDQKIARTLESSRKLAIEHPELFPLQITHSLALLKSGRRADALKVFESSNVQLRQLLPFQKAVFATVLRANGKEAVGEQIWRQIDPSVLLPREQALFEKISSHDPLDQTPEDILPEAER